MCRATYPWPGQREVDLLRALLALTHVIDVLDEHREVVDLLRPRVSEHVEVLLGNFTRRVTRQRLRRMDDLISSKSARCH